MKNERRRRRAARRRIVLLALRHPGAVSEELHGFVPCPRCGGTGRTARTHKPRGTAPCPRCEGAGGVYTMTVAMPSRAALKNRWRRFERD